MADTSVLIFATVTVVLAPLRAVIFTTTGLTMTASAFQLLRNLPPTTNSNPSFSAAQPWKTYRYCRHSAINLFGS